MRNLVTRSGSRLCIESRSTTTRLDSDVKRYYDDIRVGESGVTWRVDGRGIITVTTSYPAFSVEMTDRGSLVPSEGSPVASY